MDKLGVFHANQISMCLDRVRLARRETSKIFLLTVPRRYFFCGSFVLFMTCVCHAFTSVHCCHVVTCRERVDLLALVCDVYCDFVTFAFGILGKVWYLIVSIPDLCCLFYFYLHCLIYILLY